MVKLNIKQQAFTVPGFQFSGIHCGIKDKPHKKDLGLIWATESQTTIGGVFTQNLICAGPVKLCRQNLKTGSVRLVVVNSGVANAATGDQGLKDAWQTANDAAKTHDLSSSDVFVCSTGRIGERVPVSKIKKGILSSKLKVGGIWDFAKAICTTDAFPKLAFAKSKVGTKKYHMAVIAKGAGMIEPNMATMLCHVVTDLKLSKTITQQLLQDAVNQTLNCLTVDGDMSTNDTTLLLASGLAGNAPIKKGSNHYQQILKQLVSLLEQICEFIALDGEGATKCFRVHVTGAKSDLEAKTMAKAISNSQLVKTAVFGCDPNWGRIICAAGYSGAKIVEKKTVVKIGAVTVFSKGKPLNKNEKKASDYLKKNQVVDLHIQVNLGRGKARMFASDLTYGYVRFNAEYRT